MPVLTPADFPLPSALRGGVIAIGNFDGVHLGHQALLARARGEAEERGVPFLVLTFTPHPRQFFSPQGAPRALISDEVKAQILDRAGARAIVFLPFDAALAALSAEDFISRILQGTLGARGIVVGPNFRFGQGRTGTPDTLRTWRSPRNSPPDSNP